MVAIEKLQFVPLTGCPKCGGPLYAEYYTKESSCILCGFVDYTTVIMEEPAFPKASPSANLMTKATIQIWRYKGDAPSLKDVTVTTRIAKAAITAKGHRSVRVNVIPTCPFDCGLDMEQASLSGKRKNVQEVRYRCASNHRVSLVTKTEFDFGRQKEIVSQWWA